MGLEIKLSRYDERRTMENLNNRSGGETVPSDGDSQWNSVEGEMDKFDVEAARQAVEARRRMEDLKAQKDALRDEVERLGEPSGNYYMDGGEVREVRYDTTKTEGLQRAVGQEYREARDRYEALSTPEGRETVASQLREQAAEEARRSKYLQAGLRDGEISAEIQALQDRLSETQDPEARKHLENAIARQEERAIVIGKAMFESEVAQGGNEDGVENLNETDETKAQASAEEEQSVNPEWKALLEKAAKFPEQISESTMKRLMSNERVKIQSAIRKIERLDDKKDGSNKKLGFFDKRDYDEATEYLKRCRRNSGIGKDSRIFDKLKSDDTSWALEYESGNLGKERAENYKIAELTMNGEHGRDFKKALRQGRIKMPESWDDESFTFDEMRKIANLARMVYRNN